MAKVAAKAKDRPVKKKQTVGMKILTILFSIVSVFYVAPVFIVLMNSFKSNAAISRAIFEFPNADSFQGFQHCNGFGEELGIGGHMYVRFFHIFFFIGDECIFVGDAGQDAE